MKILYFTASGNSLYVAKSLKGELYSIPQCIKEDKYEFDDEVIGIVFPLHAWSVNPYIENFLRKAKFNCKYLFAIVTYGIYSAGVANHLKKISSQSGYKFDYINKIRMVDNYLPYFDMEKEAKKEEKKQIEKQILKIQDDIKNRKHFIAKSLFLSKIATNHMVKKGKKLLKNKKTNKKKKLKIHTPGEGINNYYYIDDKCTHCGICSKVCPVDNINVNKEEKKIELKDKCFMCFACIQNCPLKAFHINGEKSSNRFRNKNIQLKEIIESNK